MGVVRVTAITSQLVQKGVKVIKTFQEKDRETGLASNGWNVLVEVCNEIAPQIPHSGTKCELDRPLLYFYWASTGPSQNSHSTFSK